MELEKWEREGTEIGGGVQFPSVPTFLSQLAARSYRLLPQCCPAASLNAFQAKYLCVIKGAAMSLWDWDFKLTLPKSPLG